MNQSVSARAEQLFLEASELAPAERNAFLQRACADHPVLRQEVDALLEAFASASAYFDSLPERLGIVSLMSGDAEAPADRARDAGEAGQEFGQYRLTKLVGSGGMGTVWRAERSDGRFEGDVAVKLLSRSAGGAAPERFALEGRYLAKLTHPNVARLLDAGVGPNEQAYLVLEFVNGLPIDQYCDQHALDIEQRIRLFLAVLDAVAHAHARLIVHRDIKPSNVQVDAEGTVKLLDFGVAKLLGDDAVGGGSSLTREMGAALTPEYAAPEQLNGETVTTATDIYSLGLLLWLLVTGSNLRNTAELRSLAELRALAQREPTRLLDAVTGAPALDRLARVAERRNTSSPDLLKTLRSDLDNIVRKALAVDPAERYQTVADFAQDLTRYLRHEPVIAQAQTIRYRAQKFLRRHRGGVLAASLTVLALITAAAVTAWQSVEAQRQRDLAIYQQQRVQATNEFLTVLLSEVGSGDEPLTLVDLLDRGTAMLDRQFGADERFIAHTLYTVANFYGRLGRVDRQLELFQRAETIAREIDDHHLLGLTLCAQARVQRSDDPEAAMRNTASGRAALATLGDPPWDVQEECYRAEALALEAAGDREAAIAALQAALRAVDASPTPSGAARALLLNDLSEQYYKADRANEALALNAKLLAIMDRIGRGGTIDKVIYLMNRAAILSRMGEMVDAAAAQQEALVRIGQLEGAGHIVVAARGHYANSLFRLARYEEALELFTTGRESAAASGNTRWVAQHDLLIGVTLARLGRTEEAEDHLLAAEAVYREDPGANARLLEELSLARARMRLHEGDVEAALDAVSAAFQRAGYPQRKDAPGLSSILWTAAQIALAAGDAASAEQYANDGYEIFLGIARDPALSADIGQLLLLRAKARHAQGNRSGAVADLQQAITSLVNGFGDDHPETREARELMALAGG
jgi:eukaryotic-like serine/threonine-protein kinase